LTIWATSIAFLLPKSPINFLTYFSVA
jgi:hypothetical protein